ncbi:EAL domain-containing protein [Pokkaliibacter plantistimulans]|uniref:EAL domain-containing protein n=1 Tax=Pokkaliibacter plantistimulans TaxID=1635171 RepID=UPI0024346133|nr:EAL domain-containing protein [Pokkaliibacter plantistimulans]
MQELTEVVVEASFSEMKELLTHYADLGLSINLSMENLVSPLFLGFINDLSKRYELNPNQLTCEVTVRSAAGDDKMAESARQFAAHSYKISLDDFGTGYSNLSWLSQLDADEIKVDRVFTQAIGTSSINQNMLTAIFQLVHTLGVQLVFEGIESQHEVDYILRHSTDAIGQGWLFSNPVSVEVFKGLIEKNRANQETR